MTQNAMPESFLGILIKHLGDLEKELKEFRVQLKYYQVKEDYSNIPRGCLENADHVTIAEQLIDKYGEACALEITGNVLQNINQSLSERFKKESQIYLDKNNKLRETGVKDHSKSYKEYMMKNFRFMQDKNSPMCENIKLNERCTKLLILKQHRCQAERENQIMSSGWEHLAIMAQQAEHSYSSIEALFDPDEKGEIPRIVVLQGAAKIGKTMTARKMMLDWASGELFQDRFDYVFYINCREINQLSGLQTIADLLSHTCPGMSLPMREIEAEPEKLLFIIDGFDELNISKETHTDNPMTLIRNILSLQPYVLITTRPTALEKVNDYVDKEEGSRFGEILGFSEDDKKQYFITFFNSETQGAQVMDLVKENDVLYTMCYVPILCWIICTVIKQQMEDNEGDMNCVKTATSVYMSFFSSLLKQQSSDSVQPIHMHLQKLCALAKEGVWEKKILFYEEDLVSHGLDIPAIQSLFLTNDIECENCYSFIHLSFQEFFAAMFYLLKENEGSAEQTENPIPMKKAKLTPSAVMKPPVMSLLESTRKHPHLTLTVRFLFGLLNKETVNRMENRFKWEISPDVKPALLERINGVMRKIKKDNCINSDQMELLHCLYEIQDEEIIKTAAEHVTGIAVSSHSLQRQMTAMDCRALGFWLKNSPGVERVTIARTELSPAALRALTPGLMTCSSLSLWCCPFTAAHCAELCSVLSTNTSLTYLYMSDNTMGDSAVIKLCEGLKVPGCRIQTVELKHNGLTDASTEALCSALSTNRALRDLGLMGNLFTQRSRAAFSEFQGRVRIYYN